MKENRIRLTLCPDFIVIRIIRIIRMTLAIFYTFFVYTFSIVVFSGFSH